MRPRSWLFSTLTLAILAFGCASYPSVPTRAPEIPAPRPPAPPEQTSDPSALLRGRLIPAPDTPSSESPILVYLEPITPLPREPRADRPKIVALRRRGAELQPGFVLAHRGQVLLFSNHDDVYHAIFSYSEPNAFELGTLGVGETEPVTLSSQGIVRFYCSLHESEHGLIFVAPSQYLALADARGEYSLVDVPPGRYRLRTWSDAHTNFDREITLRSGESAWREIELEAEPGPE